MSFYFDINEHWSNSGQMKQVVHNLITRYLTWYHKKQKIPHGTSVFDWQNQNGIPRLSGINDWAQENFGIFFRPYYNVPEERKTFFLDPMPDRCNWNFGVDGGDNFVGPRSKQQLKKIKFFKSRKNLESLPIHVPYGTSLEAIQWKTDVHKTKEIYYAQGFGAAVDYAMSQGYRQLIITRHLPETSVKGFFMGFPGSHGMHSGHERLWLVMKFGGSNTSVSAY